MKIKKRYDRHSGLKYVCCFYDFPSTNYQRPIKNCIPLKKMTPPPLAKKILTSTSISTPPPPPQSEINNANSNVFEQLHKYQQCKKGKHLPPISPFSFFHFSSKK